MAENGEFRFEIQDLTPWTLSMRRLQEYIPHLVEVFGNQDDIHLLRVDEGSAVPCVYAKSYVIPRVNRRLLSIREGTGSLKAYRAMDSLNDLLAEDNTSAVLRAPHWGIVIEFPGNKAAKDPLIGPVSEHTELQGELFQIGGRDETISAHLRNDGEIFICTASREQGREMSKFLFSPIRVWGAARWIRRENGRWKLVSFVVDSFKLLNSIKLGDAIAGLRALEHELGVHPGKFPSDVEDDE